MTRESELLLERKALIREYQTLSVQMSKKHSQMREVETRIKEERRRMELVA